MDFLTNKAYAFSHDFRKGRLSLTFVVTMRFCFVLFLFVYLLVCFILFSILFCFFYRLPLSSQAGIRFVPTYANECFRMRSIDMNTLICLNVHFYGLLTSSQCCMGRINLNVLDRFVREFIDSFCEFHLSPEFRDIKVSTQSHRILVKLRFQEWKYALGCSSWHWIKEKVQMLMTSFSGRFKKLTKQLHQHNIYIPNFHRLFRNSYSRSRWQRHGTSGKIYYLGQNFTMHDKSQGQELKYRKKRLVSIQKTKRHFLREHTNYV